MAGIEIHHLSKTYTVNDRRIAVLADLELHLNAGEFVVVLGPSGCGKTTLLRVLGGLEAPDDGHIDMGGERCGTVFQEPRLMPWLTVLENILFGLVRPDESDRRRALDLLAAVGLSDYANARPAQLSGGMKSRCALARTLCPAPQVLFMDEPFAALDYFTREAMQHLLLRLHEERRFSALFVTHSVDEALTLGSRVLVMERGRLREVCDLCNLPEPRDLLSTRMVEMKRHLLSVLFLGRMMGFTDFQGGIRHV